MKRLATNRGMSLVELLLAATVISAVAYFSFTLKQNLGGAQLRSQTNRAVATLQRSFLESVTDAFFERSASGVLLDSTNPYWMRIESNIFLNGAVSLGTIDYSVTCESTAGTALEGLADLGTLGFGICNGLTGPNSGTCTGTDKRLVISALRQGMEGPGSNLTQIYPLGSVANMNAETKLTTPVAAAFCADVPAAQVAGPPNPYNVLNGSDIRFHLATATLKRAAGNRAQVVWKQELRYLPVRPRNVNGITLLGGR